MMVSCFICGGSGKRGSEPCRPCKTTGWIEILGCGMVDPNVFEFVKHNGYDSKKVSGFAFGMGADRIAILKYGCGRHSTVLPGRRAVPRTVQIEAVSYELRAVSNQ